MTQAKWQMRHLKMRVVSRPINKPELSCLAPSPNFTHQANNSAKHIVTALAVKPWHQFQNSFRNSLCNVMRS